MIHWISSSAAVLLVAILTSLPIDAFAADTITEDRVHALVKRMDDAITKRDIPVLLACFTEDAAIVSDWLSEKGVSRKKFSRREYGEYVREQFPTATKRSRTHAKTRITITDSGTKATIATETAEAVTMPGAAITIASLETLKLVQRGNELLITSLDLSLPKDSK